MRIDDLLISLSYFSIPIQLALVLFKYPRVGKIPLSLVVLLILFILFILLCGLGHLLRAFELHLTSGFDALNWATCVVSAATALYLFPVAPRVMNDLNETLNELVKTNEETAASKHKLFTFMSFLCHEIRNPLFAITSNIEFAQDMVMSQELEESLRSINQSATLMLRLVNDVLDLSKIESGKLELDVHEFDLREFFQNLASNMSLQVKAKRRGDVDFTFNISRTVPRMVWADSVRVLQIVYNILSNAIKFTEKGSITFTLDVDCTSGSTVTDLMDSDSSVGDDLAAFSMSLIGGKEKPREKEPRSKVPRMSLSRCFECTSLCRSNSDLNVGPDPDDSDGDSISDIESNNNSYAVQNAESDNDGELVILRMTFEDTGTGIDKEQLDRIFQPYAQSKLSDFRKHGGTGLGLSIISKLLEMMEGSVQVHSVLGQGSTFVVHLPLRVSKYQPAEAEVEGPISTLSGLGQEVMEDSSNRYTAANKLAHNTPSPKHLASVAALESPEALDSICSGLKRPIKNLAGAPLFAKKEKTKTKLSHFTAPTSGIHGSTPAVVSTLVKTTKSSKEAKEPERSADTPKPLFGSAGPSAEDRLSATGRTQVLPLFSMKNETAPLLPTAVMTPTRTTNCYASSLFPPATRLEAPAPLVKFQFENNSNLVLVVDDNAVNRKLLSRMLAYFNLQYQTAENGQVAVDMMKKSRNATGDESAPYFGMIIMDLSMPVMDGYEAIYIIRKKMHLNVPIVALTANAMEEEKRKCLENGATEFATKPILRPTLHAKCTVYLGTPTGTSESRV